MITLTHENGYGNIDTSKCREKINEVLRLLGIDISILRMLVNDYENLLSVIEGKVIFEHSDGSETRRIKLYY